MTTASDNVKFFDACVLASITSGVLLVNQFGLVHEAMEHIAGHPVWTHELPGYSRACTSSLTALYPWLPTSPPADWQALAKNLARNHPVPLPVPRGTGTRDRDPVSTLVEIIGQPAES